MLLGGILVLGEAHPYPQAITGPLLVATTCLDQSSEQVPKKNQKDMVVFSVSVDSIPNKKQAETHGTALSSLHIIAKRLFWRLLAQACRQDGKSSAISLWAAPLVAWSPSSHPYNACRWRICVHDRQKPTKPKGYVGARPCIASLPISFLSILNSASRRMKLVWVWTLYATCVASCAAVPPLWNHD